MARRSNSLSVGRGRLGWMSDGNPDTPETATLLEDDGRRITLTVPWPPQSRGSQYERWFSGELVHYGDDPDRNRFSYRVPEILWFEDSHGPVALVGCRAASSHGTLFGGAGQGIAVVSYAVFGVRGDFRKINGLRSELPGLGDWMGLRSITQTVKTDHENRISSVEIRAKAPEALRLDRRLNLTIRPNWRTSHDRADSTTVRESLQIESLVSRPRDWDEHLGVHRAVRDLLDVATWRPNELAELRALRMDEPERTMAATPVGPKWAPVLTRSLRRQSAAPSRLDHLFTFENVGVEGVRRWFRLRDRFRRGVDPMLSLLDLEGAHVGIMMAQSGLAFEAIGYELALEAGESSGKADSEPHIARLRRVVDSLPEGLLEDVVDVDDWARRSTDSYNAVKHANRTMPDPLTLLNTERESELIFRTWVATRIGVPSTELKKRLAADR